MVPSDTFHLISIVPMTLRRWSRLQPHAGGAGPIVTQGDDYTEVVGDADGCVVATGKHTRRKRTRCTFTLTLMGM